MRGIALCGFGRTRQSVRARSFSEGTLRGRGINPFARAYYRPCWRWRRSSLRDALRNRERHTPLTPLRWRSSTRSVQRPPINEPVFGKSFARSMRSPAAIFPDTGRAVKLFTSSTTSRRVQGKPYTWEPRDRSFTSPLSPAWERNALPIKSDLSSSPSGIFGAWVTERVTSGWMAFRVVPGTVKRLEMRLLTWVSVPRMSV